MYPYLSKFVVPFAPRPQSIACGKKHAIALLEGGYVVSWGVGYFGQLGHGDDHSWDSPRLITALDPMYLSGMQVVSVSCGSYHSGAVISGEPKKKSSTINSFSVYMWGFNRHGQCGVNSDSDTIALPQGISPAYFSNTAPAPSLSSGSARASNPRIIPPNQPPKGSVFYPTLVCGRNHSALLVTIRTASAPSTPRSNKNIGNFISSKTYTWGSSTFGRLGLEISPTKKKQPIPQEVSKLSNLQIVSLATGDYHMLALSQRGTVYSWGGNTDGQCGVGNVMNQRTPRLVDTFVPPPITTEQSISSSKLSDSSAVSSKDIDTSELRITEVYCGPNWSYALAAVDKGRIVAYGWGCGEGQWLGIKPPMLSSRLPHYDADHPSPFPSTTPGISPPSALNPNIGQAQCLESSYNVLSPRLIRLISSSHKVHHIRCGGTHTLFMCQRLDHSFDDGYDSNDDDTEEAPVDSVYDAASSSQLLFSWCRHGKLSDIVTLLLAHPELINEAEEESGNTPLIIACQNEHEPIVRFLVVGLQQQVLLKQRQVQLLHASAAARTSVMSDATTKTLVNVDHQNKKGNTALHFCFSFGFAALGEFIVEQGGANCYLTNEEGLTCYEGLTQTEVDNL